MRYLAVGVAVLLCGCSDFNKPAHYYVLCEGADPNGWKLVDTFSRNGYLLSCTYQSPDKRQSYTVSCNDQGCD
jgi:hypothetical protein